MLARRFPRELSAAESSLRVPLCDEAPLGAAAGPRPLRLALCAASRARPARGGSYLFLLLGVGGESCVSYVAGHQACKEGGCVSRPLSFAENKVDRFHVTSRVKCALRGSRGVERELPGADSASAAASSPAWPVGSCTGAVQAGVSRTWW